MKRRITHILLLIFSTCLLFSLTYYSKASAVQLNGTSLKPYILQKNKRSATAIEKIAFLTFDDGPNQYTSQILNVLDHYQVKGTFFLIGKNVNRQKQLVKYIYQHNHYIGMHSMTHVYNKLYKENTLIKEILMEQKLIASITGHVPVLFRPPYGSYPTMNLTLLQEAKAHHLKLWDWNVDSYDWKYTSPQEIINSVKRQLNKDVVVILMHDRRNTALALPEIIRILREEGYTIKAYNEQLHFSINFFHDRSI